MQSQTDIEDERNLMGLLESFGSTFSLDDIATAYCEANYNVNLAAEILCASNKVFKGASKPAQISSTTSSATESPKSFDGKRNTGAGKSKFQPASLGTVAGVVGRNYIKPKSWTKPYQEVNKPLKLDAKELPESVIWGEKSSDQSTAASKGTMSDDVVNFLFKMLGDGFELEKNKIQDVLGLCGYDVKKTMEELLDMSNPTLEKCDDVHGLADEYSRDQHPDVKCASSEELCNSTDSPNKDKDRVGLQKEILGSLFSYPQRSEEAPKRRRPVREIPYLRFRRPVVDLPEDTTTVQQSTIIESQNVKEESDDDENSYKVLRRAVKEHWSTMKEYYKAAFDAFVKNDYARADRLLEQGHFYNRKAREADEKSAQKLLQTNETNDDDDDDGAIPLDLHEQEPKQALRLLKCHLTSLCGIHTIKYLRVIVGTGDEDRKGTRKRSIIKQLEKNSIEWTEEDNGRSLRLQVDVIDPKSLSFGRKQ